MGLEKAKAFVAQLTVEEKADMVTGQAGPCVGNIVAIPRLGFPGLCLQDGPLGIRVADYASVVTPWVVSSRPRALRSSWALSPVLLDVPPTQAATGKDSPPTLTSAV